MYIYIYKYTYTYTYIYIYIYIYISTFLSRMQIIQFTTDWENISKAEKLGQRLPFAKQIKMTQPNWYHRIFQTVQRLLLIKLLLCCVQIICKKFTINVV